MVLGLIDILKMAGFDDRKTTKLVRHQSQYDSIEELRRNDWLEVYQAYQKNPVFHKVEQIISFYGLPNDRACFYGVYRVHGVRPVHEGAALVGCPPLTRWRETCDFFYAMERDDRFDNWRDRFIIDWGRGSSRSWHQRLKNKQIVEILPPGRKLEPFRDFLEFSLTHAQLKDLFKNEEAHRAWKIPISNVGGIYLILAQKTGDLYIGSAYGATGIWGRWQQYADTGDGGNVKIKELIAKDPDYPASFRFSILHILPRSMSRDAVIQRETEYKIKLGTRAVGLNSN